MTGALDAPGDDLEERRYWGPTRIGLTLVVVATVLFWVWIYLFAPRGNPDRLETRSFAEAAESVCAAAQLEIDELPLGITATDPADRARQVEAGTVITVAMVADLEQAAEAVTNGDDLRIIALWLEDWDAYVADRWAHVEKLDAATGETSPRDLAFTLTERAAGGIYTRKIDGLANVNDMASCHVPGDV